MRMTNSERHIKPHQPPSDGSKAKTRTASNSPSISSSTEEASTTVAKVYVIIGAVIAGLAVVLGAFAAHGLKGVLLPSELITFETGVRYQMYHGIALLCLPGLATKVSTAWANRVALCFITGCLFFSGSLYLLATTGVKWFGPITPLGGVFFIVGWILLIVALVKGPSTSSTLSRAPSSAHESHESNHTSNQ